MRARHSLTYSFTHLPPPTHTQRLPPGYRDLIEFFGRYPGLVKWTGIPLLLYFNAGSLDVAHMFTLWLPLRLSILRVTITRHARAPSSLTTTVMVVSSFSFSLTFGISRWRKSVKKMGLSAQQFKGAVKNYRKACTYTCMYVHLTHTLPTLLIPHLHLHRRW